MSIANYLTALDGQRVQLARNLTAMGVQATETEKLNTLVPKVLQIPQTKQDITLFKASIDTLHDFGEKLYTFYNDGYRYLSLFWYDSLRLLWEVLPQKGTALPDNMDLLDL